MSGEIKHVDFIVQASVHTNKFPIVPPVTAAYKLKIHSSVLIILA